MKPFPPTSAHSRPALLLFSLVGLTPQLSATPNQPTPPNIILFLVDDMGWQDTSLPFWKEPTPLNRRYRTPNMERLARQGIQLTQAYASSVSSPSRVSLLSGMNAARHRVTNWTLHRDQSTDLKSDQLIFPQWNVNGVCQEPNIPYTYQITPFVRLLQQSGYRTIHCGKAHWGAVDTPGANPLNLGFDVNISGSAAGGLASYLGEQNYGNRTDGQPSPIFAIPDLEAYWGTETFATEALTREAIKELDKTLDSSKPFFLYMAHYAVHIPIDKDMRFYPSYIAQGLSPKEAAYASLVEGMDKSLGDLMDWLEAHGKDKETLILFLSDNGGLASSAYWRDAPLYQQNAPLNSGKGSAYEGGVRIPMLVRWDGHIRPHSQSSEPLIIEDLFPTLLEVAQIREPKTVQPIDGISLLPLWQGKRTYTSASDSRKHAYRSRPLYWNFPNLWGNTGPGIGPTCSIRWGDWKLVYYYETGRKELFNIRQDIGEQEEVSSRHPKVVKKLSHRLGHYLREVSAQRPSFRSTGKPCPFPDEL